MKVAVIHPNIMVAGGAEVTGLMTLEFFQDRGDVVTFITDNAVDFTVLNKKFSTHISHSEIRVVRPRLCRLIGKLEPRLHLFAKLQLTLFARYARKHKREYDLVVSTKQEADLGRGGRGIQFLHHPPDGMKTKFYDGPYLWFLRRLGRSDAHIASNLTISPSYYIKYMFDNTYGLYIKDSQVLYPAIRECPIPKKPWSERENGFIMAGHIDELKKTKEAIEVIDRLRMAGFDLHLHIIGTGEGKYYQDVLEMAKMRPHIHMEGFVSTQKYFELLVSHKYGIHMRGNEPSAVTLREFVDCGMIVFAHNSGGTPEILNKNRDVLFDSLEGTQRYPEESAYSSTYNPAARMIEHVMENEALQKEILLDLKKVKFNTREDWKKELEGLIKGMSLTVSKKE